MYSEIIDIHGSECKHYYDSLSYLFNIKNVNSRNIKQQV